MKRNRLSNILLIFTVSLICSYTLFAKTTPDLFLNGDLKDIELVLKNANTLIPLRFCSEELNAQVDWNKSTQEIVLTKGNNKVLFTIGSLDYLHNGEVKKLSIVPELINGVTYVPFRPLVEGLDGIVFYNNAYKFINIYDAHSQAYNIYNALNSTDIPKKRFAMLEAPRISNLPSINATTHEYIFPLETPSANYFLEYQGNWEDEPLVSLKYYAIIDGVAVNTWGRQVKQTASFPVDTHPLFKLIGDAKQEDKIEFGSWPNPIDLNYAMFLQDASAPAVFYLNPIWTNFFALDSGEKGQKAINPFSNQDIILFDIDNETLLNKYN